MLFQKEVSYNTYKIKFYVVLIKTKEKDVIKLFFSVSKIISKLRNLWKPQELMSNEFSKLKERCFVYLSGTWKVCFIPMIPWKACLPTYSSFFKKYVSWITIDSWQERGRERMLQSIIFGFYLLKWYLGSWPIQTYFWINNSIKKLNLSEI